MASVMEVQHTPLLDMEDVVTNPVRQPGWGMFGAVLIDQQPIFRLKPKILLSMVTQACCWSVLGSNRPRSCGLRCDTWTNREQSAPEPRIRWSSQPPSRGGARAAFDDPLVSSFSLLPALCSVLYRTDTPGSDRAVDGLSKCARGKTGFLSCVGRGQRDVTSVFRLVMALFPCRD